MVVDHGTAAQARVSGVDVGGKTGTAQWGAGNNDKSKSRTAWWFVGFAPVDKPQYAFASLVEGDPGDKSAQRRDGGAAHRQGVARDLQEQQARSTTTKKRHSDDDDDAQNDDTTRERHP